MQSPPPGSMPPPGTEIEEIFVPLQDPPPAIRLPLELAPPAPPPPPPPRALSGRPATEPCPLFAFVWIVGVAVIVGGVFVGLVIHGLAHFIDFATHLARTYP